MSEPKWTPPIMAWNGNEIVAVDSPDVGIAGIAPDADERLGAFLAASTELYEALASIENDDGSIPKAIWEMRNAALAKARGES